MYYPGWIDQGLPPKGGCHDGEPSGRKGDPYGEEIKLAYFPLRRDRRLTLERSSCIYFEVILRVLCDLCESFIFFAPFVPFVVMSFIPVICVFRRRRDPWQDSSASVCVGLRLPKFAIANSKFVFYSMPYAPCGERSESAQI